MSEFKWTGVDEALGRMQNLSMAVRKGAFKRAVRMGAVVIQKQAQSNARRIDDPSTKNSIPNNIAVQYSSPKSKAEGGIVYRVGVQGGAQQLYRDNKKNRRKGIVGQATSGTNGATWYWRFIELGTSKMRARPFMVPALMQKGAEAQNVIVANLDKAIDAAIKSAAKSAARKA